MNRFPSGFLWGAASSSYQIEGATQKDGRSESVWDRFCRIPGKIADGSTGDTACDHYRQFPEDIQLLANLGVGAYRFSIDWPRILPAGTGRINSRGIEFYDRLVDELLRQKIIPYVNFYHWDHPQVLEDKGGWRKRDFAYWFAEFAAAVAKKLSDRVSHWMTLNEPPCIAYLSYRDGFHAPGAQEQPRVVNQIVHHVLLAHGLCIQAVRAATKGKTEIGLAHNLDVKIPYTNSKEDVAATYLAFEAANGLWFDPLFKGEYPEGAWGEFPPTIKPGDMEIIASPMDYMGLNIYHGSKISAAGPEIDQPFQDVPFPEDYPKTTMGWPVVPESMYWGLKGFSDHYTVPKLFVTENGSSFPDELEQDGRVRDPKRIDFLERHLAEAHRFIAQGGKLAGYFLWTLMDNFEWAYGYTKRFGIYYTEYGSQRRIAKDSARWLEKVIRSNGL